MNLSELSPEMKQALEAKIARSKSEPGPTLTFQEASEVADAFASGDPDRIAAVREKYGESE